MKDSLSCNRERIMTNRKKIIFGVFIATALTVSYYIGTNSNGNINDRTIVNNTISYPELLLESINLNEESEDVNEKPVEKTESSIISADNNKKHSSIVSLIESQSESVKKAEESSELKSKVSLPESEVKESISVLSETELSNYEENSDEIISSEPVSKASIAFNEDSEESVEPDESSVSESELSFEPESSFEEETVNQNTCTVCISCKTAVENEILDKRKKKLQPSDGNILTINQVEFNEGESVFDVLKRVCGENNIRFEFSLIPLTGGAYIEGINNLYEFDCGSTSGWMYSVNGHYPNVGCSDYYLKKGDIVEIKYTCNLGEDIGNHYRGRE